MVLACRVCKLARLVSYSKSDLSRGRELIHIVASVCGGNGVYKRSAVGSQIFQLHDRSSVLQSLYNCISNSSLVEACVIKRK